MSHESQEAAVETGSRRGPKNSWEEATEQWSKTLVVFSQRCIVALQSPDASLATHVKSLQGSAARRPVP